MLADFLFFADYVLTWNRGLIEFICEVIILVIFLVC